MFAKEARELADDPGLQDALNLIREAALKGEYSVEWPMRHYETSSQLEDMGYEIDVETSVISWARRY